MFKNIVFIDSRVQNQQTIVDSLTDDTRLVLLNADQDGVLQMQAALAGYSGLDSIQIISHGSMGALYLGSTVLNQSNLSSYQSSLQAIGSALTETGDLLLYGCNVAQGDPGVAFILALAGSTGADVAASNDATGAVGLGGDWDLEKTTGPIDSVELSFNRYSALLADTTAPTLTSLSIPSSVNLSGGAAGFTISGTATDDISGVKQVNISLDKNLSYSFTYPSTSFNSYSLLINSGIYDSWSDGSSSQTWGIGATNPNGVYNVTSVSIWDVQGNSRSYTPSQLNALGIGTSLVLTDGTFTPNVLSIGQSVEPGKIVLSLSTTQWLSTTNSVNFGLSYDSSIANFVSWRAGGAGSYAVTSSGSVVGSSGVLNFTSSISNGGDNTGFIDLIFSTTTKQGAFAYGVTNASVNSATVANVFGNYQFTIPNFAPTGTVTITGATTQGQTLSVVSTLADLDGLGTISYQWKADGSNISGATGTTLTLAQAQVGKTITVAASYTDGFGTAESVSSNPTAAVANVNDPTTGAVAITGTATQGQTLTAANTLSDADGLGTISYQWKADGSNISGATGSTLNLAQAQVGKTITVAASYTDGYGTAESVSSNATAAVANVNDFATGAVTVTGTATQGQTLTAANTLSDLDGLGTISYQWKADGSNISGATGTTLTLAQAQVGKTITVAASYTDGFGTAESVSSNPTAAVANVNDFATGAVTVTGTATQGQTLTAANTLSDLDGLGTISYQWKADGSNISGATGTTLTLAQVQVGKAITVTASYTDGFGTSESMGSSATSSVANVNDLPTGAVSISGNLTIGQTLTASNTLADADGLGSNSYQWRATGSPINGATGNTFTLTQDQVGKTITVAASYTDGFRTTESVTSNATGTVTNITGTTGNDILSGGAGNDTLDGGAGIDVAVFSVARENYTVTKTTNGYTVADKTGAEGTDTLANVERLKFSDFSVALDVSGNAGTTAKILGAVFGKAAVANKEYAGIGLQLMDAGMSYLDLMQLAINAKLGAGASHAAVVNLLYTNVVGTPPPADELALYQGLLDSGAYTRASLGVLAADTAINTDNVKLVGLATSGLEYLPQG